MLILSFSHAIEHVELGDAQAADAVDRLRTLQRDDVHPAATTLTAGGGAVSRHRGRDALPWPISSSSSGREQAAAHARGAAMAMPST